MCIRDSTTPLSPAKVRFSSTPTSVRQPATEPSPSRHEQDEGAKTEGVSAMTELDDALAILTSVVTEDSQPQNNQPHLTSTAVSDDRGVRTPTVVQAPCIGQSYSCALYSMQRLTLRHCCHHRAALLDNNEATAKSTSQDGGMAVNFG